MAEEIKKIIEENSLAFATVDKDNKPHVIAVAYVKVKEGKLIVTNNYMDSTIDNIKNNSSVGLAVWNKDWEGYRIDGEASYFEEGEYYDFVKSMKENKDEPGKGAIVVDIKEIKKLG